MSEIAKRLDADFVLSKVIKIAKDVKVIKAGKTTANIVRSCGECPFYRFVSVANMKYVFHVCPFRTCPADWELSEKYRKD